VEKDLREAALEYHRWPTPGKISVRPTKGLTNQRDLALAYSPGFAAACDTIVQHPAHPRRVPALVEAMKARRVLMSRTGPRGDVLKVRPPLVLAERHADHLVSALRDVLTGRDT